jgi:hypothetical protein
MDCTPSVRLWFFVRQVFDQNVTRVAVGTDAAVRSLLAFAPSLPRGVTLAGMWADNSTLVVSFTNVSGTSTATTLTTAVGAWMVSILSSGNLFSAVGQSAPSNASTVVRLGSWCVVPSTMSNVYLKDVVAGPCIRGVPVLYDACVATGVTAPGLAWTTSRSRPYV